MLFYSIVGAGDDALHAAHIHPTNCKIQDETYLPSHSNPFMYMQRDQHAYILPRRKTRLHHRVIKITANVATIKETDSKSRQLTELRATFPGM
jgi:hypothetical protein